MGKKLKIMDTKRLKENFRFPGNSLQKKYKKRCVNGKFFLSHITVMHAGQSHWPTFCGNPWDQLSNIQSTPNPK